MRLIDADALKEKLKKQAHESFSINDEYEYFLKGLICAEDAIDDEPIVDAVPVRHGKWIEYPTADGMNQCSECGVLRFGESNYCPNCGARMDEE